MKLINMIKYTTLIDYGFMRFIKRDGSRERSISIYDDLFKELGLWKMNL